MVIRALLLLLLTTLPAMSDSLRLLIPEMRPVVGEMIPVTIRGEYTGSVTLEKMVFPDSPPMTGCKPPVTGGWMNGWTAPFIASLSGGSPSFHVMPAL
ncbi:hypothetical protein ACFSS8_16130 [Paracoccus kondratievae]